MNDQGKTKFLEHFPVSQETMAKLQRYAAMLAEWNEKFNLVSPKSMEDLWTRHFLDSAQLVKLIPPQAKTLADIGSGAGFPGMVLAIMAPKLTVHLIESVGKKAKFLKAVVDDLKLNVTIQHSRVEDLRVLEVDVVTARAVTDLLTLLSLSKPLIHRESVCLYLKGQNADTELTDALKYWTFKYEKTPSISSEDHSGTVLKITELKIVRIITALKRNNGR